jgi:hypothetical protein
LGYEGAAPSNLSLALIADALGNDKRADDVALSAYLDYMAEVARLPHEGWTLTQRQVIDAATEIANRKPQLSVA